MIRKILHFFGLRILYVSGQQDIEDGYKEMYSHRYDSIDHMSGRPIHKNMSVAPPWYKLRIVK